MARLNVDLGAYNYANGLRAIGLMYQAAKTSLEHQRVDLSDCTREYDRATGAGYPRIGEWEEGHKLWEQGDLYRLEQQLIDDALTELRAAICIAIYHHWEKNVPSEAGEANRRQEQLKEDARKRDIPLHADINALCYAANYFKHGNAHWLKKLKSGWEARFGMFAEPAVSHPAWVRRLVLSDDDIHWFLEIAKVSERSMVSGENVR
ncbi:MAG: hypothetical protein U0S50_11785 [Sphingopyxis sp.]|uniref:hypothetical protein n=1 Tax=Sphingopyxis sp. TaxID=1908224 RepID=UPI002ABC84CF|nr:hypothetical protein [Sphingopyxis sp.]MDZ3832483.1 hypothetical protein [Sphingopyxis sp.]